MSFEELITSKDKYQSISLKPNGDYCDYYTLNIFRNAHLGILSHMMSEQKFLMDYNDG